jgi:hypothetical protein
MREKIALQTPCYLHEPPFGVILGAFFIQISVHFHAELQCIVDQSVDRSREDRYEPIIEQQAKPPLPIPMRDRVFVEDRVHERQKRAKVFVDKADEVIVVPKEESPFGHLEMVAADTSSQSSEERDHKICKGRRVGDVEDFFYFVQEHDFFGAVHLGPVPEQEQHHILGERSVLFQELNHTVHQLRVVRGERGWFV